MTDKMKKLTLRRIKFRQSLEIFSILWKNQQSRTGMIILGIFIVFAVLGDVLVPELKMDYANRYANPSWQHILGTDYSGRDTLAQFILGTRSVLSVAYFAGIFTVTIAMVVGLVSGFIGGKVDSVLMMIANIMLNIPTFPVTLVFATIIKVRDPITFGLLLSIWSWAGLAKAVRTQIMAVKSQDFVEASRIMGISTRTILKNDIMPNVMSFVTVSFIGVMKGAILASVGLIAVGLVEFSGNHWAIMIQIALGRTGAFLGNWGGMLYFLTPTIGILLFQYACLSISNGLDKAFNPRLR